MQRCTPTVIPTMDKSVEATFADERYVTQVPAALMFGTRLDAERHQLTGITAVALDDASERHLVLFQSSGQPFQF